MCVMQSWHKIRELFEEHWSPVLPFQSATTHAPSEAVNSTSFYLQGTRISHIIMSLLVCLETFVTALIIYWIYNGIYSGQISNH